MESSSKLQQLVREHRGGHSLAQPFYVDPELFEMEVARFLGPHWLLVGHVAEIAEHGDYFVVEAFGASVMSRVPGVKVHETSDGTYVVTKD